MGREPSQRPGFKLPPRRRFKFNLKFRLARLDSAFGSAICPHCPLRLNDCNSAWHNTTGTGSRSTSESLQCTGGSCDLMGYMDWRSASDLSQTHAPLRPPAQKSDAQVTHLPSWLLHCGDDPKHVLLSVSACFRFFRNARLSAPCHLLPPPPPMITIPTPTFANP